MNVLMFVAQSGQSGLTDLDEKLRDRLQSGITHRINSIHPLLGSRG